MEAQRLLKSLGVVIKAAYMGSAEHGSFFRPSRGEMSPNAFLVLEDAETLTRNLLAEITRLESALARAESELLSCLERESM